MTAYRCNDCEWIGRDLTIDRAMERVDDGPAIAVVIESCPDCGAPPESLTEVALCIACLCEGIDNEATADDYCLEHAAEEFEPEDMEVFHRDQVQPISPKVKA